MTTATRLLLFTFSPAARSILESGGVRLETVAKNSQISPTGLHGKVFSKEDAIKFLASTTTTTAKTHSEPTPSPPSPSPQQQRHPLPVNRAPTKPREEMRGVSTMRKVIATRLSESKSNVPHVYAQIECAVDAVLDMRAQMKALDPQASVPSMNDVVVKACALALRLNPKLNSRIAEDGKTIIGNEVIDVSVAVATPNGLITPIVTGADVRPLESISIAMKDLATRARANKLKPAEYQGGSISVSNLGMMGVDDVTAVINPPQCAILAVGSGIPRAYHPHPPPRGGGSVPLSSLRTQTIVAVTLSADRRIVNEVEIAKFLATFKRLIESPLGLFHP